MSFPPITAGELGLLGQGLLVTLGLTLSVFPVGLLLGAILAACRHARLPVLGPLATVATEGLRSVPLILWLLAVHYGLLPLLVGRPGVWWSAGVGLSLFEAAYLSEILRGGLRSITPGERESAAALGLPVWRQWTAVFLPLAGHRMRPALVNQAVTLLKDTSLASILGLVELTRTGEVVMDARHQDGPVLLVVALLYATMATAFGLYSRRQPQKG